MKRTGILSTAENLVHGDRHEDYAHPIQDFSRTADLLNALGYRKLVAGTENFRFLGPSDVPFMMICVKLSRLMHRFKVDSAVDIAGYIETLGIVHDVFPEED